MTLTKKEREEKEGHYFELFNQAAENLKFWLNESLRLKLSHEDSYAFIFFVIKVTALNAKFIL
jgi:hypothetical protein